MSLDTKGVYIIGEIGVNHNGDMLIAKKLIQNAKNSGVNAVKFQSVKPEKTKIKAAPFAKYQQENVSYKSSFEMSMKLRLSYENHKELIKYCEELGVTFFSTGFDEDSVDMLDNLGVQFHKIPSGEINNFKLIKHIALKNKPIIISTGMAELYEIDECIKYIRGYNNSNLTILHCVSLYPTDFEKLNLNFIKTLKHLYDAKIGFSDHTLGIEASIAAVALGAEVIERHITLDKTMEGPDHKTSLNPEELKLLVQSIRNIEKALGSESKVVCEEELEMRKISRRSIVVEKSIKLGERFSKENISIKKPGTGISPKYYEVILGRKATKNLNKDNILTWEMVGELI